jgi:predicted O-methyltransferase YrrM
VTIARDEVLDQLWHGQDPFDGVIIKTLADIQGWNSDHPYLAETIDRQQPDIVIEVGVWKGASALTMAKRMRQTNCDGVVIAVDTWLGSAEHWLSQGAIPRIRGASLLYEVFMTNVMSEKLRDYILPLPLDSASACEVLARLDIRADVIHIDAAHDYQSVTADLTRWWKLLRNGGTMIADDYGSPMWPMVTRAVDHFVRHTSHAKFAAGESKCRFDKVE